MEQDTWWDDDDNAQAGVIAIVPVADDTRLQLEVLFGLLDRDGSGALTQADFEVVPPPSGRKSAAQAAHDALLQREILVRWHELRRTFDFSDDQVHAAYGARSGLTSPYLPLPSYLIIQL